MILSPLANAGRPAGTAVRQRLNSKTPPGHKDRPPATLREIIGRDPEDQVLTGGTGGLIHRHD